MGSRGFFETRRADWSTCVSPPTYSSVNDPSFLVNLLYTAYYLLSFIFQQIRIISFLKATSCNAVATNVAIVNFSRCGHATSMHKSRLCIFLLHIFQFLIRIM